MMLYSLLVHIKTFVEALEAVVDELDIVLKLLGLFLERFADYILFGGLELLATGATLTA